MSTLFQPIYQITPAITDNLAKIEQLKKEIQNLPLTPTVLASLRETARLYTTHYSTMIEGNRLDPAEIEQILKHDGHFPGRERDEKEIMGYYVALKQVEIWGQAQTLITAELIQTIHALVMSNGKLKVQPTPYRDGQNVIRDGRTKAIVYMPPTATDVPELMQSLLLWMQQTNTTIACPIQAAIAHYQFATIHPYYDGNGRTARLLTTLILHLGGYDLKGLYSLEEYYARNLPAYYAAISVGPSHNYYLGRAEADITDWIEYFIGGMTDAFEKVMQQMRIAKELGATDHADLLRQLDPQKRLVLSLFKNTEVISLEQISQCVGYQLDTTKQLCKQLVATGFLELAESGHNKTQHSYKLAVLYRKLLE
jgi:Fic family protein